jgi:hypothetical protein
MPIPKGAHLVPGSPNRVLLPDGETVTRATALTMGARDMGYRSHRQYRGHASGDSKYFNSWKHTQHGREVIAKERAIAQREGRRYSESELKQRLIAARNARPHGDRYRRTGEVGRPAGEAFRDFMDRYDVDDEDIYY